MIEFKNPTRRHGGAEFAEDFQKMDENDIATQLIGAAVEVHRVLGPGLLESVYQRCLARELELRNIS